MHIMHTLNGSGHDTLKWTLDDAESVKRALAHFTKMTAAGALAFSVPEGNAPAEQIRQFDPDAREIVFAKPLIGG